MGQTQTYEKVQYGAQTSAYATEAGTYTELSRVQNIDFSSQNNNILDRGLGEGINAVKTYYGPFDCNGNMGLDINDFTFLQHWIGNKSGSGTVGDPYKLTEATSIVTAAAAATKMQVFSIEKVNDTESTKNVEFMIGAVGTNYQLSGRIGSKLNCTANFTGRHTGYRTSGTTYTPVTTAAYTMINGTWKWGATPSTLSGVRAFTVACANGLVLDTKSIESRFIGIPLFGERAYTFRLEIIMATALATTLINNFYGLESGGVYTPETGSVAISPTSSLEFRVDLVNASNYARVNLDECTIDRISKPASLGGGISVLMIDGHAHKGKTNVPISWWTV